MISSYLKKTSKLDTAPFVFFLLAFFALLCAVGYWKKDMVGLIAIMAGIPFVLFYAFKPETYLILFISYFSIIPSRYHGETYELFFFYYNKLTAILFFIVFAVFLNLATSMSKDKKYLERKPIDITGLILTSYLVLSVFSALRGLALGHHPTYVFNQIIPFPLFLSYFLLRKYFRWKNNYLFWMKFFFLLGVAVAVFYAYITAYNFTDIFSFVLVRAVTQHGQVMIATIPLAASFFLISKSKWIKAIIILGILLFFIQIFLSQQRILWVVLVFQVGLFPTLYIFRNGFNLKNFTLWSTILFSGIALLVSIILFASWYFQTDLDFLLKRWENVQNLTDGSFMMRVWDSRHAIQLVKDDWFWGTGMGGLLRSVPTGHLGSLFDQSYLFTYFYGGLFLAISLTLFYASGIYKSFIVFYKSSNENIRMIGLGIVIALTGEMVSGLTDVTMTHLPHVFLWIFLIAMATVMYEKYILEEKNTFQEKKINTDEQ